MGERLKRKKSCFNLDVRIDYEERGRGRDGGGSRSVSPLHHDTSTATTSESSRSLTVHTDSPLSPASRSILLLAFRHRPACRGCRRCHATFCSTFEHTRSFVRLLPVCGSFFQLLSEFACVRCTAATCSQQHIESWKRKNSKTDKARSRMDAFRKALT